MLVYVCNGFSRTSYLLSYPISIEQSKYILIPGSCENVFSLSTKDADFYMGQRFTVARNILAIHLNSCFF